MQVVRARERDPGTYALDYVYNGSVFHKLIENVYEGYRFEGSTEVYFRCVIELPK